MPQIGMTTGGFLSSPLYLEYCFGSLFLNLASVGIFRARVAASILRKPLWRPQFGVIFPEPLYPIVKRLQAIR
jgi:hypothetical protein